MASIYKKGRDQSRKRSEWYIAYTDADGKRKTVKGFRDKGQTEQLAAKLEHEVMLRKRGLIDAKQEKLVEQQKRPIEEHLTGFQRSMSARTEKHIKLTMARVRRILDDGEFTSLSEIELDPVLDVLEQLRTKEKVGPRTYNHYCQAMQSFLNWCLRTRRLATNPLLGLETLNTATDIRHKRRALSSEEFSQLVASARSSGESIQCFDGETRARIYILSYMTGLRRKEIASLTPASFRLNAEPPILTVEAACSKHRREDVLPIHPELVTMLRVWLRDIPNGQVLFDKLARRRTWLMVKKDLARVGIPYLTADGVADFHAAGRHTHITELLRNGATLTEARELARHSDVNMTMRYTHIGINDQAKALSGLPAPKETKSDQNSGEPPSGEKRAG